MKNKVFVLWQQYSTSIRYPAIAKDTFAIVNVPKRCIYGRVLFDGSTWEFVVEPHEKNNHVTGVMRLVGDGENYRILAKSDPWEYIHGEIEAFVASTMRRHVGAGHIKLYALDWCVANKFAPWTIVRSTNKRTIQQSAANREGALCPKGGKRRGAIKSNFKRAQDKRNSSFAPEYNVLSKELYGYSGKMAEYMDGTGVGRTFDNADYRPLNRGPNLTRGK